MNGVCGRLSSAAITADTVELSVNLSIEKLWEGYGGGTGSTDPKLYLRFYAVVPWEFKDHSTVSYLVPILASKTSYELHIKIILYSPQESLQDYL